MSITLSVRRSVWVALVAGLALGLAGCAPPANAANVSTAELMKALHWRSLGPYTGGRVTSVAGVAGKPNLYYAGYADGGVWKTVDYGHHWKNITDGFLKPNTDGAVGAIAVAPSNPKVIYVGTGDSAPRNTIVTGHGVYKSTDRGKTWKYIGLGKTHIITWILVDPKNANIVYVGSLGQLFAPNPDGGVYKSTDGGRTWKKVLSVNDETGVATMAMDQQNPNVIYVTMWQMTRHPWTFTSGGPGSGIYKTTDGGTTWQNISHNPGLPTGVLGKIGIAVAPSNPNVVYADIQATYKGTSGALFRSSDAGRTWQLMNTSPDITQRSFYFMRVYVDPKDPNTIYLPNVGVYTSHDGGKKLITLHPPHGDNHAFWINPDNTNFLVEGNDGGATVSLTRGTSWSSEDNQPTGQFYRVNLDKQFPFNIYTAQQDRDPQVGPSAVPSGTTLPPVWTPLQGDEMSQVVPVPKRPWVTFGEGFYSSVTRWNRRTKQTKNVSAWSEDEFGYAAAHIRYRFGYKHRPVTFLPKAPHTLLLGANVVFESTDDGLHWRVISPDLTRNDKAKEQRAGGPISTDVVGEETYDTISVLAGSPLSARVIWAGSDDGLVHVTTNGGQTWTKWKRPASLPKWSVITSITPSFKVPGGAYVSASRYGWDDYHPYVYETTDYGQHWTQITTGLPADEYVEVVRQDPAAPSLLVAGTSAGMYVSFNGGAKWESMQLNLPVVRVNDIQFQAAQHAIVVGTYGRGLWSLDNLQYLQQVGGAAVASGTAHLFRPQQTWLTQRRFFSFGGGTTNAGQNLAPGANIFFYLPAGYKPGEKLTLSISTASGQPVYEYKWPKGEAKSKKHKATLHVGVNRVDWDLRYPTLTSIKGIYHHFLGANVPIGPWILPGKYNAVLTYGGKKESQQFVVTLDPRVHATPDALHAQFALATRIYRAIDVLNTELNIAITERDTLEHAPSHSANAVAALNAQIGDLVDLRIQSMAGPLMFPPKLRAWLSRIFDEVETGFGSPTASQEQAANKYLAETKTGIAHLKATVTAARR